jgi:hypothetical protein
LATVTFVTGGWIIPPTRLVNCRTVEPTHPPSAITYAVFDIGVAAHTRPTLPRPIVNVYETPEFIVIPALLHRYCVPFVTLVTTGAPIALLGLTADDTPLLWSADGRSLYVSRITVDEGATMKRFLPRAHGRATPLLKRTSHITIVVDERSKRA